MRIRKVSQIEGIVRADPVFVAPEYSSIRQDFKRVFSLSAAAYLCGENEKSKSLKVEWDFSMQEIGIKHSHPEIMKIIEGVKNTLGMALVRHKKQGDTPPVRYGDWILRIVERTRNNVHERI